MIVSLSELKLHLRVDGSTEDTLITYYAQAAEERVASFLNRQVYETQLALDADVNATDTAMVANDSIKCAIMLLTGHLYKNREATVDASRTAATTLEMPMGVKFFLYPYRVEIGV